MQRLYQMLNSQTERIGARRDDDQHLFPYTYNIHWHWHKILLMIFFNEHCFFLFQLVINNRITHIRSVEKLWLSTQSFTYTHLAMPININFHLVFIYIVCCTGTQRERQKKFVEAPLFVLQTCQIPVTANTSSYYSSHYLNRWKCANIHRNGIEKGNHKKMWMLFIYFSSDGFKLPPVVSSIYSWTTTNKQTNENE